MPIHIAIYLVVLNALLTGVTSQLSDIFVCRDSPTVNHTLGASLLQTNEHLALDRRALQPDFVYLVGNI
jgi:hypothetical protein